MKFNIKINLSQNTFNPLSTRHLSNAHEKISKRRTKERESQLSAAVAYCRANNCKGYLAIKSGQFPLIKDPRTINKRLTNDEAVWSEKPYLRILTIEEEGKFVKYLKNKNRCAQGLTQAEANEIVLNILKARQDLNRKGGRKFIVLSENAKKCLHTKTVGRSFWRRLLADNPTLRKKKSRKISVNRGLNCTHEMATNYLDELAEELIKTGIAPNLVQVEPGVWEGDVDTSRIWAHDETPQFINYRQGGNSQVPVFGASGEDCQRLIKENRDCVTVHPFSSFDGDMAMCQVLFSGSGHSSHMVPQNAADRIRNLLVTVNECGVTENKSLLAAYKHLDEIVEKKGTVRPIVIITDGHLSRFHNDVMNHCDKTDMNQFIIPSSTSGCTQKHDQVNDRLHKKYEERKDELFTCYSSLNRESFMNILADIWEEWATPELLIKAAKRVGISKKRTEHKLDGSNNICSSRGHIESFHVKDSYKGKRSSW